MFLLVLTWLTAAFGNQSRTDWQKIILSYDNMCHLDNLKVAKQPLPLPGTHCMCVFPKRYCAWLHNSLPMQVILSIYGRTSEKSLTPCTSETIKILDANRCTALRSLKKNTPHITPWAVNKLSCGYPGSKKLFAQCRKRIIISTFTGWWNEGTLT